MPTPGTCYLCQRAVDDVDEFLCAGCGQVICDFHPEDPWGRHRPEDHDRS